MATTFQRIDTLHTTELAEGVEIQLRSAGPLLRIIAWLLDTFVIIGVLMLVGILALVIQLSSVLGDGGTNIASGVQMLASFFIFWLYPVVFEAGKRGATIGKRATGLRVVNEAGTQIGWGQSMIRNFLRMIEVFLPLLPLVSFFHPRFRRLGDLAAGTYVVYERSLPTIPLSGPPALETVPIPISLSREEQAAILAFRDRSAHWSEARRAELVDHLHPLTGARGNQGVEKVLGMGRWLEERS